MSRARPKITPALQTRICSWIRMGGYPHVAAEAAGVPHDLFEHWLEKGRGAGARKTLRELAAAIEKAQAEARLAAELKTYANETLIWLRCGPGKEAMESPGWTTSTRQQYSRAELTGNRLLQREVQELLRKAVGKLKHDPNARVALANIFEKRKSGRR